MAYAVLDGIELCKISDWREPDPLIADEGRTASGAFRRDVIAMGRSWVITLRPLNADEFAIIQNHFLSHAGRSLFWYRGFGGQYPQDARAVVVRADYRHFGVPGIPWSAQPYGRLLTEDGDVITTEDGDALLIDTLRPVGHRDYLGGEIKLTITQVPGSTPGGGWANTHGTESFQIPGPEGPPGPQGPPGAVGARGSSVITGNGPPEMTPGQPGDVYIDADSGDVYRMEES